jgi:hypothetical protein
MRQTKPRTLPLEGVRDPALVKKGCCGAIDVSGRLRCYRQAGHDGPCVFVASFQLRQS